MLVSNSSRPITSFVSLERLWLANALERVPLGLLNQPIHSLENLPIAILPILIILPGLRREEKVHPVRSESCLTIPSPRSSESIASLSRFALTGDRKRYAVSESDS